MPILAASRWSEDSRIGETTTSVATLVASLKRLGIEKITGKSASDGESVFMDTLKIYAHVVRNDSIDQSNGEYARVAIHINRIEYLQPLLKHAQLGVYH